MSTGGIEAHPARSGRRLPADIRPQNDADLVASDRVRHGQPGPDAGAGTSAARPQGPPETSLRQPVIRQLPSPHSAVIRLVPVPSGAETAHCASILPGFSSYSRMIGSSHTRRSSRPLARQAVAPSCRPRWTGRRMPAGRGSSRPQRGIELRQLSPAQDARRAHVQPTPSRDRTPCTRGLTSNGPRPRRSFLGHPLSACDRLL